MRRAGAGFSLVELVAVMVIVGVLSAIALPRFADTEPFAARGFYDEAAAAARYAQGLAIASGCATGVEFSAAAGTYRVLRYGGADCNDIGAATTPVTRPGSTDPFVGTAPAGVTIDADLSFHFDRIGRPRNGAGVPIDDPAALMVGIGGRDLRIAPATGMVGE